MPGRACSKFSQPTNFLIPHFMSKHREPDSFTVNRDTQPELLTKPRAG